MSKPHESEFVWYDSTGIGRNRFAAFRCAFQSSGTCDSARLSLFADSSYQLFVNGAFVTLGPSRFDHRYPQFDTIDIEPYLVRGENVVAVLVKSFGCKTFRSNSFVGGFVAWGGIAEDGVDFSTRKGGVWRCRRYEAFASDAIKMSFALDPIDVFRQADDLPGWKLPGYDESGWHKPVPIEDQAHWGVLEPRRIPMMSHQQGRYEVRGLIEPLSDREEVLGFSVQGSGFHGREKIFEKRGEMFFLVSTQIYSPRKQSVFLGLFWGRYYLNDVALENKSDSMRLRKDFVATLEEGWNDLLAIEQCHDDAQSFLLALPKSAGLQVCAEGEGGDPRIAFKRSEILCPERIEAFEELGLSREARTTWGDACQWISIERGADDGNPARRSLWDHHELGAMSVTRENLSGYVFEKDLYPDGFSFVLEFPHTQLLYPILGVSGVSGAQIDLCYGERFLDDSAHLLHNIVYQSGDRILPSEDTVQFITSQPRGARYVRVTVRNANADVRFNELRFITHHYPVEATGSFFSSDPVLNEVWKLCERTQRVNMEDAYVDCVGRERGMYVRDTNIQFHNALALCGDTKLMSRCMELVGQSPDESGKFRAVYPNTGDYTITDFSMEAVEGYWQYYLNTGDIERLRSDWGAIQRNIHWFDELSNEREDGLLDANWPQNRDVTAAYGGFHGDNGVSATIKDRTGPNASLTFSYLLTLERAASIARLLGYDDEAERFLEQRARVAREVNRLLWNDEFGCYNDNLEGKTQSPHASIWSVIANVANENQEARIATFLKENLTSVFVNGYSPDGGVRFSPSYSFFIFKGLYRLGLYQQAEALMRQGWGWMMAQGSVTTLESFGFGTSSCHAWSASPMYYLSRYALGVSFPNAPDFSVVEVQPMSNVSWARGSYPIPGTNEVIHVSWETAADGKRNLTVDAPRWITVVKDDQYQVV